MVTNSVAYNITTVTVAFNKTMINSVEQRVLLLTVMFYLATV